MHKFSSSFTYSNGVVQKNRTVLAPMTNGQSHEDGTLSDAELHWLQRRAEGGFGMIISAASHVQPTARAWAGQLGCFADAHVPGLTKLAEIGRRNDALTILQVFHGGVRCPRSLTGVQPTAPSVVTLDFPNFETPRALNEAEIEAIIENFVAAGRRAHQAGLSGIEVHGANGYLFTQFLSRATNMRADRWGGTLENRARLLIETTRRMRAALPAEFIIGVRVLAEDAPGPRGFDIDETLTVAGWLADLNIDYVHLSADDVAARSWAYPDAPVTNLRRYRSALPPTVALIASGGVGDATRGELALAEGADLIAVGKAAIATADWPLRAVDPAFAPAKFPISRDHATGAGVSVAFQNLLVHYGLVEAMAK